MVLLCRQSSWMCHQNDWRSVGTGSCSVSGNWQLLCREVWYPQWTWILKADSHKACRAHAIPLPYHAAKGLECVFPIWFTQCGRVWFALAMPRPCHAQTMLFFSRPRPSRDGLWATCLHSASSSYHTEFTKIFIRSIPILLTTIHTYNCKEW